MPSRPRFLLAVSVSTLLLAAGAGGWALLRTETPEYTCSSPAALRLFERAREETRRYRWFEAREFAEQAVRADSSFACAYLQLARVSTFLGDTKAATQHLKRAMALREGLRELERLEIEHFAAVASHDEDERSRLHEELAERFPDAPVSLELRARDFWALGQIEEARRLYEVVLAKDPSRVDVHNMLGYLALEAGDYEAAVTSLQRYAFYAQGTANPHDSLGEVYLWTGRYHEAYREYLEALEIDPTFISSALGAVRAFTVTGQLGRARKVLQATRDAFEQRRALFAHFVGSLRLDMEAERWSEVAERLQKALGKGLAAADSMDAASRVQRRQLLLMSALAQLELGDVESAQAVIDSVHPLIAEERAASSSRHVREELDLLELTLDVLVTVARGADAGALLQSAEASLESISLQPHRQVSYRCRLARASLEVADPERCLRLAIPTLDFNPHHPCTNLTVGKALLALEQPNAALVHLERFLDVMHLAEEGHPRVKEARQLLAKLVPTS